MGPPQEPSEAALVGRGRARERAKFSPSGGNGVKRTLRGRGGPGVQALWTKARSWRLKFIRACTPGLFLGTFCRGKKYLAARRDLAPHPPRLARGHLPPREEGSTPSGRCAATSPLQGEAETRPKEMGSGKIRFPKEQPLAFAYFLCVQKVGPRRAGRPHAVARAPPLLFARF